MGMVAPLPQIASAYFVVYGQYGEVSRYAKERGVCRQWVYREADGLRNSLATSRAKINALEQRVREKPECGEIAVLQILLLLLVGRHPLEPGHGHDHRQEEEQLGVLRYERLDEEGALLRI